MKNTLKIIVREVKLDYRSGLVADLIVDGRTLQDRASQIELPYATQEGYPELAGGYESIAAEILAPPSRYLFGEPPETAKADNKHRLPLLDCSCGFYGCWPLCALITVEAEKVIWSDFTQPYRSQELLCDPGDVVWSYTGLGRFIFDLSEYEKEWRALAGTNRI
jgi:hypothetical protein